MPFAPKPNIGRNSLFFGSTAMARFKSRSYALFDRYPARRRSLLASKDTSLNYDYYEYKLVHHHGMKRFGNEMAASCRVPCLWQLRTSVTHLGGSLAPLKQANLSFALRTLTSSACLRREHSIILTCYKIIYYILWLYDHLSVCALLILHMM